MLALLQDTRRRRVLVLTVAVLVAVLVPLLPQPPAALLRLEHALRDPLQRLLAQYLPTPAPSPAGTQALVVVDIDEHSLAQIGPWPWSADTLATLSEQLLAAGAQRVALDLVLPATRPGEATGQARLATLAEEGLVVLAQAFDFVPRDPPMNSGLPAGALALSVPTLSVPAVPATGVLANTPDLAVRARCVGNIGVLPDADGVLRRLPWRVTWQGRHYPSLAEALVTCAVSEPLHAAVPATAALAVDTAVVPPRDADGFWHLPFRTPPTHWPVLPAASVLQGTVPLPANALVLVGSSALGLSDRVATPLSGSQPGVLVHAEAAQALLAGTAWALPLQRLLQPLMPVVVLGATVLLFLRLFRASRLRDMAPVLALCTLGWLALALLVVAQGLALPISGYALTLMAWLGLALPLEWAFVQRSLNARLRMLERYVTRPVLNDILSDRTQGDPLQPRRTVVSVLFADIEDFSRLSAELRLEDAARLTRDLMEVMSAPVWASRGTLDKYLGDGLMAFWGAPLATPDHAREAASTAFAMQRAMAAFNASRPEQPPLRVRIGIATGEALVGDLGTRRRATYTAIGDCVNLAARLQGKARFMAHDVLLSEACAAACPPTWVKALGVHDVRGMGQQALFALQPEADITPRDHPPAP